MKDMEINFIKHALYSSWDTETAYSSEKEKWNVWRRSIWQCAITSLVVNDLLWWIIKKWTVNELGFSHYWNEINNEKVDLTKTQFDWEKISISNIENVSREKILTNIDTKNRYDLLSERVNKFIKNILDKENDISNCNLCKNIFHFEHNSIYFWNKSSMLFIWEAPAKNWWRITWKAWINEKWKVIPSWNILDNLLKTIWLELFDVSFVEAVKCLPIERKYIKECANNCSPILNKQIELLKPNLLLPLWEHATKTLLKSDVTFKNFSEVVGKEFIIERNWKKYIVLPIYHPSPVSPLSFKGNIPIFKNLKKTYFELIKE